MEQDRDTGDVFPNISDVIDVIAQDEAFSLTGEGGSWLEEEGGGAGMSGAEPRCVIVEQPASKALRFRYECEGRSAGSIPGINSTAENKTYPTIQIENYKGRAVVVVSCVTKDAPFRPHPHSLVGKEGCKQGVCTMEVNTETMSLSFANLGIQCIKKKDIDAALDQRKQLRIDPFKTGYGHKHQPGTIDLNAVRLCFQVFLEGDKKNQFSRPIMPVVSEPIYDKKAMSDLVICKLSEVSASVIGGREIILLCEKVAKEDISVRLYEEHNGQVLWEGQCDFQPTEVHKQVAISFRTPRYKNIEVTEPVRVMIQLVRPSDKASSEPRPFLLTPIDAVRRKRPKVDTPGMHELLKDSETQLRQSEATLLKHEIKLERDQAGPSGAYGMQMLYQQSQLSPVYHQHVASPGASPVQGGAIGGANQEYMATIGGPTATAASYNMVMQPTVYAPHASPFSPASQGVASPEHQASVSPLPQLGHPMDQINNLNMIQQLQVNMDNNLNIIQQHTRNIDNNLNLIQPQQHSPMQQHNIDNNLNLIQPQQHSPMQQHNIDNMIQREHNMVNNIGGEHVVMDMDTQQHSIELSPSRLDSSDLKNLDLDLGLNSVSDNLSANLRLNDDQAANNDSMTDSLSRIPSSSLIYYPNNGNNQ